MKRQRKLTVAVLYQDGTVRLEQIPDTLQALQKLVGGYIEAVPSITGGANLVDIVNDAGLLLGLKANPTFPQYVGNVIIAAVKGDRFRSLTYLDLHLILPKIGIGGVLDEQLLQGASKAAGP